MRYTELIEHDDSKYNETEFSSVEEHIAFLRRKLEGLHHTHKIVVQALEVALSSPDSKFNSTEAVIYRGRLRNRRDELRDRMQKLKDEMQNLLYQL